MLFCFSGISGARIGFAFLLAFAGVLAANGAVGAAPKFTTLYAFKGTGDDCS